VLGDGTQRKSYLYVQDCLGAMLHVMNARLAAKARHRVEVFNLGTDHFVQVNDSIGYICAALGLKPEEESRLKRLCERLDHAVGDGVERCRPGQRDDPCQTDPLEPNLVAATKIHAPQSPEVASLRLT